MADWTLYSSDGRSRTISAAERLKRRIAKAAPMPKTAPAPIGPEMGWPAFPGSVSACSSVRIVPEPKPRRWRWPF